MLIKGIPYQFQSEVWQHKSEGGWYFVSLPEVLSNEIRKNFKNEEEGWGRLKAYAKIGNTEWKTAIWFDTKYKTYILPLKSDVRKKEKIESNSDISVTIWV